MKFSIYVLNTSDSKRADKIVGVAAEANDRELEGNLSRWERINNSHTKDLILQAIDVRRLDEILGVMKRVVVDVSEEFRFLFVVLDVPQTPPPRPPPPDHLHCNSLTKYYTFEKVYLLSLTMSSSPTPRVRTPDEDTTDMEDSSENTNNTN
ncbi:hypothetical protein BDD12DRAFT_802738 [Trichophaea hybrida]|nr:hypothetical protein BDD12DRAFT_802738 [Trichophaea hybrida]